MVSSEGKIVVKEAAEVKVVVVGVVEPVNPKVPGTLKPWKVVVTSIILMARKHGHVLTDINVQ